MEKSVLENCGKHSEKLIEISNLVKKQKMINGEPLTQEIGWNIDNELYEAYQTILSNLKNGEGIEKAIQYLEKEIQNGGKTTNLKEIATSVSQKVVLESQKMFTKEDMVSEVSEAAIVTLNFEEGLKVLDNIFDNSVLSEMNIEAEKARQGDEKAAGGMVSFEKTMTFLGKNPKLNEKNEIGALAWMMNLAANESDLSEKSLIAVAKQYGINILEQDENGVTIVNKEKLEKLYQEKLPQNSKTSKRKIEDFKELNQKRGKEAIEEGRFNDKETAQDRVEKIKHKVTDSKKAYLEELIDRYNKMQVKGVSQEKLFDIQRKINVVSEAIKNDRSNEKNEPKLGNVNTESTKKIDDDEGR